MGDEDAKFSAGSSFVRRRTSPWQLLCRVPCHRSEETARFKIAAPPPSHTQPFITFIKNDLATHPD